DDYAECVLDLVDSIPSGRVSTYGAIAELAQEITGKGGPRTVGMVLSRFGSGVPWWRVCAAGGRLTTRKAAEQRAQLRSEGVGFTPSGHVVMRRFGWPD
ncbi:MAG TPA: MGMT family protein, partial [Beutenbergiaceae bacterium]|nr:MGMT family protein [Beutenbergiaceae bacterium]